MQSFSWYELSLLPQGRFLTPLRGDILFGHVCVYIARDARLVKGGIEAIVADYAHSPAVIVSSPSFKYRGQLYVPAPPTLSPFMSPPLIVGKGGANGKKKRVVALSGESYQEYLPATWEKGIEIDAPIPLSTLRVTPLLPSQQKSSSRQSSSENNYSHRLVYEYSPEVTVVILIRVDNDRCSLRSITSLLERLGSSGYGGGSSRGFGRFLLSEAREVKIPTVAVGSWVVTLAPSVVQDDILTHRAGFSFIHRGWHSEDVYPPQQKAPIRLVREGCLGRYVGAERNDGFIGEGLHTNVSSAHGGATIHQGYSPVLPLFSHEGSSLS
jgi:CRISPR-associated protein Csm4